MSDANGRSRHPADPETLKALATLRISVRRVVEGLLGGTHPSLHFGASVEFAEHKRYSPGDDIRHIDWRALARTDRYFVKQQQREVILNCLIVIDRSASMGYRGTRARTDKLGYAVELMAALTYILVRQGDAAGLMTFASSPSLFIPPARRPDQLSMILRHFASLKTEENSTSAFAEAIARAADVAGRRALIVIASDLLGADRETELALARLAVRGHDIAVFHILDPDEIDLPFDHPILLEGMEGEKALDIDPTLIREDYRQEVDRMMARWRRVSGESGIDFVPAHTSMSPSVVLSEFAAGRQRKGRRR